MSGPFIAAICAGCGSTLQSSVAGTVSSTANPQVAEYAVTLQKAGVVTILFGETNTYGLRTWSQQSPAGGGTLKFLVAGMEGNKTYHMRAEVQFEDGTSGIDADHKFITGSYPAGSLPNLKVEAGSGRTPQPGIEIVNSLGTGIPIFAMDLRGNVIWAYNPNLPLYGGSWLAPKQLPNGDFISLASVASSSTLSTPAPANAPDLVREFDLAGNTVKQITMTQLNAALAEAGYNLTLQTFSHDVTVLPNGHWLVIATTIRNVVLEGQSTPTAVLGDVIVDLDPQLNPVWVWNEFDHLDVNRHPWKFPDWTHTNAVIYSPDDGDLLVSIRHQNWIVKVDYDNGYGTGDVVWRFGAGGDFKLIGGGDPTDWSYAQHGIAFTTLRTSGLFGLAVMDNGDDRVYPGASITNAQTCGVNGALACYSTVPVYQIDESAMTATIQFHQILPPDLYSVFGGNALMLDNGDIEYDLCGLTPTAAQVLEVTDEQNPQTVWSLTISATNAYRSYRTPSLYPGVQW